MKLFQLIEPITLIQPFYKTFNVGDKFIYDGDGLYYPLDGGYAIYETSTLSLKDIFVFVKELPYDKDYYLLKKYSEYDVDEMKEDW